jgi:excisionase family DNA binding protein
MEKLSNDPLLKEPEVARWWQLSDQVIKRMAREGRMPAIRVGKSWRFDRTELATGSIRDERLNDESCTNTKNQ